ncbi:hypothetical protein V555_04287 [Pseudomonas aeruginosa BWH054]|nr:hypothetical protein Q058_03428 [Pseudomonas aeruginosa BL04]ERX36315.1 hypothetical protein Q010_03565 [Pseudomonas aeruginosa 19660]EZO93922.1 hypothetical protein V555_04287 [Pseudomonas aeruginosa BWH054]
MYDDSPEITVRHSACEDTATFATAIIRAGVCHG